MPARPTTTPDLGELWVSKATAEELGHLTRYALNLAIAGGKIAARKRLNRHPEVRLADVLAFAEAITTAATA